MEIVVTDLAKSREFYVDLLGLHVTEEDENTIYLRSLEEFIHHNLVLRKGPIAAVAAFAYRVKSPAEVDAAEAYYKELGCRTERRKDGFTKGIGDSVRVEDPLGFPYEFFYEVEHVERLTQRYDLYSAGELVRLDHFNQVTPDVPRGRKYLEDLGFRVSEDIQDSDGVTYAAWMHRKQTVHDTALTGGNGPRMHHVAFATHEKHNIIQICDKMGALRISDRIERGPGRHGVSNAFYLYILDPDGHRIEIYTQDYYTGDPDNPTITWDVHDNQRRDWWGNPVVPSWYTEASLVLDLDGNPQPVIVREEKSEMAVTVGADGFSYTRKEEDGPAGERTGFKLGAQAVAMLDAKTIEAIADELLEAGRNRTPVPRLTARYPDMTVEDSYAVQQLWRRRNEDAGRTLVGRKIGLTSKAMQAATGITEPDYGAIFDDMVLETGCSVQWDQYTHPRVEVELAFVLKKDLTGPGCTIFDVLNATDYVVPALEILDSRIEMEGRTIVDTIADNAAMGAMVVGGNPVRPDAVDLRWVSAILYKNQTVEETGVAAGVLDHPANGVHWLANKIAAHGDGMKAGDIILAGSFTRPALGVQGRHRPRRLRTPGERHMPLRVEPDATFRDALRNQTGAAGRPLAGMWVCSGSPLVAELCAGSGLDWLLIDAEHSPNGLESILAQLQAVHGYPVQALVRPPVNDTVLIKQYLDLGVQNLLIPMVNSAAEAEAAVAATRYPPHGVRGVGSALARAARWNRVPDYLARASETISVTVQIESDSRRRGRGGDPGGRRRGRHLPGALRPRRLHGRCWASRNTPRCAPPSNTASLPPRRPANPPA